mgnify:CR=1 FL=1
MKRRYWSALLAGLAIFAAGCGKPPVLDGNTEERFQGSLEQMMKTLPAAKQQEVKTAVELIRAKDTAIWQARGEREAAEIARVQMTGMNADDVLDKAARY